MKSFWSIGTIEDQALDNSHISTVGLTFLSNPVGKSTLVNIYIYIYIYFFFFFATIVPVLLLLLPSRYSSKAAPSVISVVYLL